MASRKLIKRVVRGGYIAADTIGNGHWETGRITKFDNVWVWFESAVDGEEIRIGRSDAYKATEKEFKEALAEQKQPEQVAKTRAAIEEEDTDEDPKTKSIVPKDYKGRYTKVKSAKGRASQICGDGVSTMLAGKELEEVYEIVAEEMGLGIDDLYARYDHLNPGSQRMAIGNRLRGHYRKNGN